MTAADPYGGIKDYKEDKRAVSETVRVERSHLKQRKLLYYGRMLWTSERCLEKEIIQGTVPGSRAQGKRKIAWIDNIRLWTG